MSRISIILLACAIVVGYAGTLGQLRAEEVDKEIKNRELVDAANLAFQSILADHAAERGAGVEDVYQWSKRLMEADQSAGIGNAVENHVDRMQQLHLKASALFNTGARGGSASDYRATRYYFLHAKSLLQPAGQ